MGIPTTTKKKRSRSRNWCFTDHGCRDLKETYEGNVGVIRYVGWAVERTPSTDKTHHQGWLQLWNPKDFSVVKRMMPTGIHLEACKGTAHQNESYIRKENKPTTYGKFVSQGFRSDLEDIKKIIEEGGTKKDIQDAHYGTWCRYRGAFREHMQDVLYERTRGFRDVKVSIYVGPTGCGKTTAACTGDYFLMHGSNLKWWEEYKGQKKLVIDEYDNQIPITQLLQLCDGWQTYLQIKGGHTYAQWNEVVITTNIDVIHPQAKQEHRDALNRRVDNVKFFKARGDCKGNTTHLTVNGFGDAGRPPDDWGCAPDSLARVPPLGNYSESIGWAGLS